METKKLTYLDVLNDTMNHYNINNRSLDEIGNCIYINKDGKSCAVGRYIDNVKGFMSNNIELNVSSFFELYRDYKFSILKKDVQHLDDVMFWVMLQELHDIKDNWNETGLSKYGLGDVGRIKKHINTINNEN